jgi:FkbM family methyltransferase
MPERKAVHMFKPIKTQLKKSVEKLFTLVPSDNLIMYNYCKRYVDRFNGDNNDDLLLNGEADFLQRYIPRCEVVFDVGANIGDWAQTALSFNRNINLHCFEPSKPTFQRLSQQIFPPNTILNNFGLGSSLEERIMYVSDDDIALNSLYKRSGLESIGLKIPEQEETIYLDTLDNYCLNCGIERIDWLKIDVEGHELAVFTGAKTMIEAERINLIQFEYGGTYIDSRIFLKDIFEIFKGLNYSFYKIYPQNLRLIKLYDALYENFQYQNWAIIRNGWY